MTVTLTDAQEMHRRYPATFGAPAQAELDAIRPGDYVQADFNHLERMWVLVAAVDGDSIAGTLSNQPAEVPLQHGDPVRLEKRHVFGIQPAAAVTDLVTAITDLKAVVANCDADIAAADPDSNAIAHIREQASAALGELGFNSQEPQ